MINAHLSRIYVATSNPGKILDFKAIADALGVEVQPLPGLDHLSQPVEDGATFEANARIKAEYYSNTLPGELVAADDSGLVVDALNGAPGVHSARYAAISHINPGSQSNSPDEDNNKLLMSQIEQLPAPQRSGKFVCVIATAVDGRTLQTFYGEVRGELLSSPRGDFGFGYDPLFYFPELDKSFGEIPPEVKARYSHRGRAFREMLKWYTANRSKIPVALA